MEGLIKMLYVLTDEDIYTIVYLCQNGVFPNRYALESESIKHVQPYFSTDDEVVVITHGLINWTFVRLTKLLSELNGCTNLKSWRVYSTIELPLNYDYTLVRGDLFHGEYIEYKNKKWGRPYKANFGSVYKDYDKAIEPMTFDYEEEPDEEKHFVNNEVPLHLVKVDITKRNK